eukprot:TRINITY_DN5377_c0_g1_i1.p1 TRINITY_DN5377_c0_g1~~TRINITY_DN5377_c0_g1_i1.p1  ORF type:complete len:1219 (-),score=348.41 TRINITY_DN5377_c0_g1_i1:124-3744(-)
MGIIWAKRDEERIEHDVSRHRAVEVLKLCRPEYAEDLALLGLSPDGIAENDFTGGGSGEPGAEGDDDSSSAAGDDDDGGAFLADDAGAQRRADKNDFKTSSQLKAAKDNERMLAAAANGQWLRIQSLLARPHVSRSHRDRYGRTAMHLAAERGQLYVLDVLMKLAPSLEARTNDDWTPLHSAVFHGQVNCANKLIDAAANINAQEKYGVTPLGMAASSPKLYLLDLVSRSDRKKRRHFRASTFRQQQQYDMRKSAGSAAATDPLTMWKFYPNRIELIIMSELFSQHHIMVDQADRRRRTPLIYAARYGRTCAVSRLLAAKANIKAQDMDGRSALFHAACNSHLEVAQMLLKVNANVNAEDGFFRKPLHGALESGDENMANLLLETKAEVNAYDCEGRTPIMLAMDSCNRRLFNDLITRRSNLDVLDRRGWNVVVYAIETGMFNEVLPRLQELGDRASPVLRAVDPQGRNSLHHAVALPNLAAALRCITPLSILDAEAATMKDCNGDTPIHIACETGRLELVRVLTEALDSAEIANNRGQTPLHYAAHSGHLSIVVALLTDRGDGLGALCNASALDLEGKSLLMHACTSGHLDLVNMLLKNRDGKHTELAIPAFDVNLQSKHGMSALLEAAAQGNWQLCPSLILAGADAAARDRDGFTALHWAAVEDEGLTISCLLDLNLDIDASDARGWTPLMHAVSQGCNEAVRVLVDSGANLSMKNWDGDTALQICTRRKDRYAKATNDILTDGIMNRDHHTTMAVPAQGHFMMSVISASDLSMEGTTGAINAYCCLQFCPRKSDLPQVAYTSCTLKNSEPEWHESFRFDTQELDPSGYLVVWLLAAPGGGPDEIIDTTALGIDLEEYRRLRVQSRLRGPEASKAFERYVSRARPEFSVALHDSFQRMKRRSDLEQDEEVHRMRDAATIHEMQLEPTEDLKVAAAKRDRVPLEERRWTEVANLIHLLKKAGVDVPKPLAPTFHIPIGCVLVRFRHLREAVWSTKTVMMDRMLRLSSRGKLKVEVDFRPRYFTPTDLHGLPTEEDDAVYDVKAEEEDNVELLAAMAEFEKARKAGIPMETRPLRHWHEYIDMRGPLQKQAPDIMYSRFMYCAVHTRRMMMAGRKLTANHHLKRPRDMQGMSLKGMMSRAVIKAYDNYQKAKEIKKIALENMDTPIQAPDKTPPAIMTKAQQEQRTKFARPRERWLTDLLESSRFV